MTAVIAKWAQRFPTARPSWSRKRCDLPEATSPAHSQLRRLDPYFYALLLVGDLRPQALLLLPELGSELGAEVRRLEHLTDLDLGLCARHRIRAALYPFDRLLLLLHLDQPKAGDQLLGLGEGTVDHRALVP